MTQGDNMAIAVYALSTANLIQRLKEDEQAENQKQVWFADDSLSAGKLVSLKYFWDKLNELGPGYGYSPNGPKTVLVLKSEELIEEARALFGNTVKITAAGKRHLGVPLGSETFKKEFVKEKVDKWIGNVIELAEIAQDDPQAALSAFNAGISKRWKLIQRTTTNISELFNPLEDVIRSKFIPAICGKQISDLQRRIVSLPYRYGGLGIENPVQMAEIEYNPSKRVSVQFQNLIYEQNVDVSLQIFQQLESGNQVKKNFDVRRGKYSYHDHPPPTPH